MKRWKCPYSIHSSLKRRPGPSLKPNNFLTSLLGEVAGGLGHQAASTMNDIDIGRVAESAWKVANNVCL